MSSLNLDLDYFQNPKVRRLVGMLGEFADIYPLRLWVYVGKYHSTDGILSNYTYDAVEEICGWRGEKGKLINALLQSEFLIWLKNLDNNTQGFIVPNWLEYQSHLKTYKERGKLGSSIRWRNKSTESNSTVNASAIGSSNASAISEVNKEPLHYGMGICGGRIPLKTENNVKNSQKRAFNAILERCWEELWSKYPRKLGKVEAKDRFFSSVKNEADIKNIQKALDNYINYCNKMGHLNDSEMKYVLHGSTWFLKKKWQSWVECQEMPNDKMKQFEGRE